MRAGAQDYLTKPFELSNLFERGAMSARCPCAPARKARSAYRRRCDRSRRCSDASLRGPCPFLLQEKPVPERRCARNSFMVFAGAVKVRSLQSIAPRLPDLLESELFGHERGAFSGAHQRHLGYAERARGGMLLLDEIAATAHPVADKIASGSRRASVSSRRRGNEHSP